MKIQDRIDVIKNINSLSQPLVKEAGLISGLAQAFSAVFNPNEPVASIAKILTNFTFGYYLGLPWAIMVAILQYGFGIHIGNVLEKLSSVVGEFFVENKGKKVNADIAADSLANKTISSLNLSEEQLNKPIDPRIIDFASKQDKLIKTAVGAGWVAKQIAKSQGGFIVRMLKIIIKALLIGGGIGVAGSALSSGIKGLTDDVSKKETISPEPTKPLSSRKRPDTQMPAARTPRRQNILNFVGPASGKGTAYHINDANENDEGREAWYVPNTSGDFGRMVWSWIFSVYPNMRSMVAQAIQRNFLRAYAPINTAIVRFNKGQNINIPGIPIRIPNRIGNKAIHNIKDLVDIVLSSMIIE